MGRFLRAVPFEITIIFCCFGSGSCTSSGSRFNSPLPRLNATRWWAKNLLFEKNTIVAKNSVTPQAKRSWKAVKIRFEVSVQANADIGVVQPWLFIAHPSLPSTNRHSAAAFNKNTLTQTNDLMGWLFWCQNVAGGQCFTADQQGCDQGGCLLHAKCKQNLAMMFLFDRTLFRLLWLGLMNVNDEAFSTSMFTPPVTYSSRNHHENKFLIFRYAII